MKHIKNQEIIFDYLKIPQKFHAGESDEELTLYKGAVRGCENDGFLSKSHKKYGSYWNVKNHVFLKYGDQSEIIAQIKDILESGNDDRSYEIINAHTNYEEGTPFLSATFNPELAQAFAINSLHPNEVEKTIYQIKIKANRCIIDPYNTGNAGESKEVLILGEIYPNEIAAVKIKNDYENSELKDGYIVKKYPELDSTNRSVKNPKNWKIK